MLKRGSDLLRLYISQACPPYICLVLLPEVGKHEIAYSVVLCFVVLEWGDGCELGWRRGTWSSTVSMRRIHPKDLWNPCSSFVPYTTVEVTRELPGVPSSRCSLAGSGRTEEEGVTSLGLEVALV